MNISIIGLGYIGLPTAAVFASREIQGQSIELARAKLQSDAQ